jgi:PAS domain S-box-containing protein
MKNKSNRTPAECEIRSILDSIHEAVIAINKQGIINVFNAAAQRILGMTSKAMRGHFAVDVIPSSRLHTVLQSGVPELNQQQQIGPMRVFTSRIPLRNQDNRVSGVVAIFHDITEIKHLTEEITDITEMKLLLEAIIDSTQDAISVTDQEGRIILVNPAYTKLIGLSREEVLGKTATIDIRKGESMHIHVMKTLEPVRYVPLQAGPQGKEIIVSAAPIIVNGQLRGSVAVAHDISKLRQLTEELGRVKSLVRQIQSRYTFDDIVAKSPIMLKTVERARRAAVTPVTVLLNGESGTGKELFAHAIHHASQHKSAPFIRVNCAAIPESLLESELFGYEDGAFTGARKGGRKGFFEEANGGTIFLDEIGEIPLTTQVKLLRVLQEKEVLRVGSTKPIPLCIRIIAATNRDLAAIVQNRTFREDLYYRINVFPITIPPLRNRIDELPELSHFLLKKLNEEYGRNVQALSPDALAILSDYQWPGNVRELENVLAGGMINMLFNETLMSGKNLPQLGSKAQAPILSSKVSQPDDMASQILAPTLEETERRVIIAALAENNGNRVATAKHLGISIRNLYYKLSKFHISETGNIKK